MSSAQWIRASRVLESRRKHSDPDDNRPWRDVSESSLKPIGTGGQPNESERSKASVRDFNGMDGADKLQLVLFQGGRERDEDVAKPVEEVGMEVNAEMNGREIGGLLQKQTCEEVGRDMAEVPACPAKDTLGGEITEAKVNKAVGRERRWKRRTRNNSAVGGGREVTSDNGIKRKAHDKEKPNREMKCARQDGGRSVE